MTKIMEPEIMTLEEVAEYLRVSVRTVYDWAQKGEIPCGKLGGTWRFRRSEVEKWLSERLGRRKWLFSTRSIALSDILTPDRVILMDCSTKMEAIEKLVNVLCTAQEIEEPTELLREIVRREELMSTGIGFGLGIPHVRLASVTDIVMAVGINKTPLADYVGLDNTNVRIVCMVAARWDQHPEYLKALSAISTLLRDENNRNEFLSAPDAQTAYSLLTR